MRGRMWIGVALFAAIAVSGCADDVEEISASASEDGAAERVDGEDGETAEDDSDHTGDDTADDQGGTASEGEDDETADDEGEAGEGDAVGTAKDEGDETAEEEGESVFDPGSTAENCGAANPRDGDSGVDCTAYGDTESVCVFSNHCLCSEDFVCTEGYEGLENPVQECALGAMCISPFDFGTSGISCGGAVAGQAPVDCTAQGDTSAFCVYGDHCACSEGFICGTSDGSEGGGNAGECTYGEICLPE